GHHYPRSYVRAHRSRANLPRFVREFGAALKRDFTCLYAIAARRSKVMPSQFERFMRDIGAAYERAASGYRGLFDPRLIAAVYIADEYAFDAAKLRDMLASQLARAGVQLRFDAEVHSIQPDGDSVRVEVPTATGIERLTASLVVNCSYSRTNWNMRNSPCNTELKHEIAEIALVEVPGELDNVGITVMDGPFFSCMPFPAEGCHSLSHVRYTPHWDV